ncbi:MAG: hypothetical protein J5828_01095 [Desulfovibrionaceae bacterium]|nr:hypothetical protein [Desulfovibrionaceae bacterium]
MDHIARSYRRRFPEHRVYLLELEHADSLCDTSMDSFCDEAALREDLLRHKRQGCVLDGITYAALSYADEARLRDTLTSFFAEAHLTPFNTVVILFPILSEWHAVSDIVTPFPLIVDVVDNQIAWAMAEDSRCRVLEQYYGLLAHAGHVVFNAKPNMDFFSTSLMLGKEAQAQCIPNWYTLPDDFTYVPAPLHDGFFHLWYSGNMNDRVDWELLRAIAAQRHVRLHLAGTASRCMDELRGLLANKSVIYHGVITERETLALLQCMDAAIVPHLVNRVSRYMDPLKIRMYAAVGLPTLCPPHLGGGVETVRHYGSRENCVQLLGSLASQAGQRHAPSAQADSNENAYMELVASVRPIPPTTA